MNFISDGVRVVIWQKNTKVFLVLTWQKNTKVFFVKDGKKTLKFFLVLTIFLSAMMEPSWAWSVSSGTPNKSSPFAPNDSRELERLFRRQTNGPVQVALDLTPSCAPVLLTVKDKDLNCMLVTLQGPILIVLSRTYRALTLADPPLVDRVYFFTSSGHWLPYDAQDAALVCDAWRFKRESVWFIRLGVVYTVSLFPDVYAQQRCVLTKKSRTLWLLPGNPRDMRAPAQVD